MVLAQIGPLTTVLETAAASVGAGVVLGSVAFGAGRLAVGWSMRRIERRALTGYLDGILGAAAAICDLAIRYGG